MERKEALAYYSRKDIQEAILACSKQREVGTMFGSAFGKRPDVLEYPADIGKLAREGATSFHVSEERWSDALALMPGMTKRQLDENRCGWDLLIDIDTAFWDYAKWTAYFIVEALKFNNVKSISTKFSGNKGLHIGVPFEAFPDEVDGINIKDHYPEGLRKIAAYLQNLIKDHLAAKILEKETVNEVAIKAGKKPEELIVDGKFDPFKIVEIDTVLISNRHLFRAPYSLHEKSGLASVPITPDKILSFEKEQANPKNVKPELGFLERDAENNEASELLIQAFDWWSRKSRRSMMKEPESKKEEFKRPTIALDEKFFPPCIKKILEGKMEDGKKRALFVLIKFLHHVGWGWDAIDKTAREWNSKNPEPLRETYLLSQLHYARKTKSHALAPNCANANYYKDILLCSPESLCSKIKNPVNFAKIRARSFNENKKN